MKFQVCFLFLLTAFSPLTSENPLSENELLRGDWIDEEARRARGVLHAAGELLERPRSRFFLSDPQGLEFEMTLFGKIHFYGPQAPAISAAPAAQDAPKLLSKAAALHRTGRRKDAIFLWKSVRAMHQFWFGSTPGPGFLKSAARTATKRMNQAEREDSRFETSNRQADPYLFYQEPGYTTVISDSHGWRFTLTGAWRFLHGREYPPAKNATDLFYLKQDDLTITIASDFAPVQNIIRLSDYITLWDRRQSLNTQRKKILQFRRESHPAQVNFCKDDCRLTSGRLYELREIRFLEYYHLSPEHGFYLKLNYGLEDDARAERLIRFILSGIRF